MAVNRKHQCFLSTGVRLLSFEVWRVQTFLASPVFWCFRLIINDGPAAESNGVKVVKTFCFGMQWSENESKNGNSGKSGKKHRHCCVGLMLAMN